jgi:hypothetical protein
MASATLATGRREKESKGYRANKMLQPGAQA